MTFPSIVLGVVVSSLIGAGFHLILGGNLGRLFLYLILSWVGFWIGHFLGSILGWTFFSIGPLNLGMGLLCSLVILLLGYWLSLVKRAET